MNTTFSIGNVLSTGFRVWAKNLLPFLLLTALIQAPLLIWGLSISHGSLDVAALQRYAQLEGFLGSALNIFVSAALTYGVVMELQGQRASIGACIGTGLSRFFPVLGVALLSALCMIGGFLLIIIPGIIVMCMLYVATPASVLERPGVMGALSRSRELTSGHRWEIFGLVLLLGIMAALVSYGLGEMIKPSVLSLDTVSSYLQHAVYVSYGTSVVFGSVSAVMIGVTYFLLRNEKEGTSASELAAVFD